MLSLAGSRLDDRNPWLGEKCMQAAGECSGHLTQVLVIQVRVVAVQLPPQAAYAAAGLPHREKCIEDDAVHTIVDPLQQLGVVLRKIIGRVHAHSLNRFAAVSTGCSRKANLPFPVKSRKGPSW